MGNDCVKFAIVTGASSGIGRQTALDLAESGAKVLAIGRNQLELDKIASAYPALIEAVRLDITEKSSVNTITSHLPETLGELVLINAAGIAEFGDFKSMDFESFERIIEINLIAPARLIHGLLPKLLQSKGLIVNILSMTTSMVLPHTEAYSASKAGLLALGKTLSTSYRKKGLRVTSISPGAVDTPIWDGQQFVPNREEMLPVSAVSNLIRDIVFSPRDRTFDEILLMPPNGLL